MVYFWSIAHFWSFFGEKFKKDAYVFSNPASPITIFQSEVLSYTNTNLFVTAMNHQ